MRHSLISFVTAAISIASSVTLTAEQVGRVQDDDWGYAYDSKGLKGEERPAVIVYSAVLDPESESTLLVSHEETEKSALYLLKEAKSNAAGLGVEAGEIEECTVAGGPGYKLLFTGAGVISERFVTKNEAGKPWWGMTLVCHGPEREELRKLGQAAARSLKLLKENEIVVPGPEEHVCLRPRLRSSIVTAGFKGAVRTFPGGAKLARIALPRVDEKPSGGWFIVEVKACDYDREEFLKEMKKNDDLFRRVSKFDKCEIFGREALRSHFEDSERPGNKGIKDTVWIWDGDLLWITHVYYQPFLSEGRESILHDAQKSFRLLRDKAK